MPGLFDDIAEWLNSGATVRTRLAKTQGPSGLFHAVANPDAVMNSEPANVGSGFLGPMGAIGLGGIMTYHGTPHKFDKFDLSKIGTGEGAQVYGRGMYFAENPQVANVYKEALGPTEIAGPTGVLFSGGKPGPLASAEARAANWLQYAHDAQSSNPYQFAAAASRRQENPAMGKAINDVLSKWQEAGAVPRKGGSLLKQDLPDEMLPKMLQWDKPFSQQPESVQKGLLSGLSKVSGKNVTEEWMGNFANSGDQLNTLVNAWTKHDPQAAAQFFKENGIPGLSYLDAGSRSTGRGTMNHVVWDQDLLNRMIPQAVE